MLNSVDLWNQKRHFSDTPTKLPVRAYFDSDYVCVYMCISNYENEFHKQFFGLAITVA